MSIQWGAYPEIQIAANYLQQGGVIAYPTEAVWGLGCDPLNRQAVADILALKGRNVSKGLILIASTIHPLLPYLAALSEEELQRLAKRRPVSTTWVVPAHERIPAWLTGGRSTLAVRITDHPQVSALCECFGGPIVSTSANPQGMPSAKTALKVKQYFLGKKLHVLAGSLGKAKNPSEIRELKSGKVLRKGG